MEVILSTAFGVKAETQTVENDPITELAKKAMEINPITAIFCKELLLWSLILLIFVCTQLIKRNHKRVLKFVVIIYFSSCAIWAVHTEIYSRPFWLGQDRLHCSKYHRGKDEGK